MLPDVIELSGDDKKGWGWAEAATIISVSFTAVKALKDTFDNSRDLAEKDKKIKELEETNAQLEKLNADQKAQFTQVSERLETLQRQLDDVMKKLESDSIQIIEGEPITEESDDSTVEGAKRVWYVAPPKLPE